MVIRNFILTLISSLSLTMFSYCSKSSDEDNLFVEITLGKNGLVSVVATDDNVSNYRFSFGSGAVYNNTSGEAQYRYQNTGIFTIAVWAFYDENEDSYSQKIIDVEIKNASGGPQVISSDGYIDDSEEVTQYSGYTLVWNDEFNYDGAPLDTKWHFQKIPIFGGSWANGERQHYTDRPINSKVSDGTLKIIALKEDYTYRGSKKEYTSARLNSKFDFQYGRLDVRAKLPASGGTWPAIWTLGTNIDEVGNYHGDTDGSVGWPACGEIDLMEQRGYNKHEVLGTFHWSDSQTSDYASHGETKSNTQMGLSSDFTTDFHIYSLVWDTSRLKIFVDDVLLSSVSNSSRLPFDNPHYLILNLAMGGTLGGDIPQNFVNDQMEIDYVRFYQ